MIFTTYTNKYIKNILHILYYILTRPNDRVDATHSHFLSRIKAIEWMKKFIEYVHNQIQTSKNNKKKEYSFFVLHLCDLTYKI